MTESNYAKTVAALNTSVEAGRFAKSAGRRYQSAAGTLSNRQVEAAYATHAAFRTGYIQQRGQEVQPGSVTREQYAGLFGVSLPRVDQWRNAGIGFVEKGIDPDSPEGRRLAAGEGIKAAVSKVLRDAEATGQDVLDVLNAEKVATDAKKKGADKKDKVTPSMVGTNPLTITETLSKVADAFESQTGKVSAKKRDEIAALLVRIAVSAKIDLADVAASVTEAEAA